MDVGGFVVFVCVARQGWCMCFVNEGGQRHDIERLMERHAIVQVHKSDARGRHTSTPPWIQFY